MNTAAQATPQAPTAPPPESRAVVSVEELSKSFRRAHVQYATLKERVLHPSRMHAHRVLNALEDISFEVATGEFFGVVGRNGSGKSTLLKCVAGIYAADAGQVRVEGRLSPFIELGVGFNVELTARDNVMISAIMLGLSRREARARFDEIVAFAELEDYLDMKLKNYSSGMMVRLAFSVAIQVDADVLLIDEVLAVGDASFQQKCFEAFSRLHREGRTILFVTHDMGSVERLCDRALLLERGRMVEIGDPGTVTRRYNEVNFAKLDLPATEASRRSRAGAATILDVWFEDSAGTRIASCDARTPVVACVRALFQTAVENPQFSLVLRNELHHPILAASSQRTHGDLGHFPAGQTAVIRVRFDNWLAPDRYFLTAVISRMGANWEVLDHRPNGAALVVSGDYESGALIDLPYDLELERD